MPGDSTAEQRLQSIPERERSGDHSASGEQLTGFEVFTKALVPLTREPTLTIQKNGVLSLNKAAEVALGSPSAVELLFDAARRVIGVRPADPVSGHSCALRAVAGPGVAPFVISAARFLRYYGIEHAVSRRRPAFVEDGILCVDLGVDGTVVTSNRAKAPIATRQ